MQELRAEKTAAPWGSFEKDKQVISGGGFWSSPLLKYWLQRNLPGW